MRSGTAAEASDYVTGGGDDTEPRFAKGYSSQGGGDLEPALPNRDLISSLKDQVMENYDGKSR